MGKYDIWFDSDLKLDRSDKTDRHQRFSNLENRFETRIIESAYTGRAHESAGLIVGHSNSHDFIYSLCQAWPMCCRSSRWLHQTRWVYRPMVGAGPRGAIQKENLLSTHHLKGPFSLHHLSYFICFLSYLENHSYKIYRFSDGTCTERSSLNFSSTTFLPKLARNLIKITISQVILT